MINQIVLVGRITQKPELHTTDNGKKVSEITLAVPRAYKNQNGEYDTDFLDCTLWTGIAETTAQYCNVGDIIGVKGRLQSRMIERDDGTKYKKTDIIAERVTFLTSKNSKITEPDDVNVDDDLLELTSQETNSKPTTKNNKKKN